MKKCERPDIEPGFMSSPTGVYLIWFKKRFDDLKMVSKF